MEFTKEIKTNWLNNLKSGKFTQGKVQLRSIINGKIHYCCLGVLAETIKIPYNERGCIDKDNNETYDPFIEMLGREKVRILWKENDDSYYEGIRDYSKVIPIIEKIPVKKNR